MLTPIPETVLRTALESVTGEPPVLAKDVHYDMTQPCVDCPFLKSSPYHQGVAKSLPEYVRTIDAGQFAHTCHKTDPRQACDGPHPTDGRPIQHCVGSIIMLIKSKKWMQSPLMKAWADNRVELVALEKIAKSDKRVFTINQMLGFYLREIEKRLGAAK
jgi:hypothetical protein